MHWVWTCKSNLILLFRKGIRTYAFSIPIIIIQKCHLQLYRMFAEHLLTIHINLSYHTYCSFNNAVVFTSIFYHPHFASQERLKLRWNFYGTTTRHGVSDKSCQTLAITHSPKNLFLHKIIWTRHVTSIYLSTSSSYIYPTSKTNKDNIE